METIRGRDTAYIELVTAESSKAAYVLTQTLGLSNFKVIGPRTIRIYDAVPPLELSKALAAAEVELESLNRKQHSLEDYFVELMGGEVVA
ncbi:hypothetical protein D3C73_1388170 [compost metagenome]